MKNRDRVKICIGIDPGKSGAVAIIGHDFIRIYDYGDSKIISELHACAAAYKDSVHVVLEKVHSMPRQGVASTFKFGENFGWWKGVIETLGIPYDLITPQKWQKVMFDFKPAKGNKSDAEWARFRKEMSVERAKRLYPQAKEYLTRKKDHGRAEALLIAGYCSRSIN